MKVATPVQIAGIQKVDDSIIVGYAIGRENQIKTFGFLQFVLNKNTDKYKMYHNHNDMLETSYLNISVGRFSTDFVGDKLLKPYYIFLSDNSSLKEIDLLEKVNAEYQIQHQLIVTDGLFMNIWALPEAGKYVFLRENNEEWFSRYFVSDTHLFTDNNGDKINMRFDIDYSDILYGSHTNISCLATIMDITNSREYYVNSLTLHQISRPCTSWSNIEINCIPDKFSADFGQHLDDLLNNIEVPQNYNIIRKKKSGCSFIPFGIEYVRSIEVKLNKNIHLKQTGQFFNSISVLYDFFNKADENNSLLKGNELQVEWLIDVKSMPDNETQTYTVRQNVPIIIK